MAVVGLLVALMAAVGNGQPTYAATITVDTTDDELNADGDCSLREAITAANTNSAVDGCAAGSGADTIDVPAGIYTLSIEGTFEEANATGDLDITDDLNISGAGAASTFIDGGGIDRVFHIPEGVTAQISEVTVQGGDLAVAGGGIYNNNGTLSLIDVTVSGNTAEFGGGIVNQFGTLTLTNSTVSDNTAAGAGSGLGGGIFSYKATLTLTNVTVGGNSATATGGGILTDGTATVTNVTVSGNSASTAGGISSLGQATMTNTIVANSVSGGDCAGPITSGGYNLDSDGSCGLSGTGDIPNTDPQLGPLADNGGPTQTHALLLGSPAVDAGDNGSCPATDQRGVARPQGIACDIGAYEAEPPPPPGPPVVGGVAGLLDADAGDATVSDGGGGDNLGHVAALAAAVGAALIAGGWHARRRWRRI